MPSRCCRLRQASAITCQLSPEYVVTAQYILHSHQYKFTHSPFHTADVDGRMSRASPAYTCTHAQINSIPSVVCHGTQSRQRGWLEFSHTNTDTHTHALCTALYASALCKKAPARTTEHTVYNCIPSSAEPRAPGARAHTETRVCTRASAL